MKKLILLSLIMIIVLLTGCTQTPEPVVTLQTEWTVTEGNYRILIDKWHTGGGVTLTATVIEDGIPTEKTADFASESLLETEGNTATLTVDGMGTYSITAVYEDITSEIEFTVYERGQIGTVSWVPNEIDFDGGGPDLIIDGGVYAPHGDGLIPYNLQEEYIITTGKGNSYKFFFTGKMNFGLDNVWTFYVGK